VTLASRLCGKVFGFVKRNLSEAKRRKDAASRERGAGKGARVREDLMDLLIERNRLG
jgi:hypothetical protein